MISLLLIIWFTKRSQRLLRVRFTWVLCTIIIVRIGGAFLVNRIYSLLARLILSLAYRLKFALTRFNNWIIDIFASSLIVILAYLTMKMVELFLELIDLLGIQNIWGLLLLLLLERNIYTIDLLARFHHKPPFSSVLISFWYFRWRSFWWTNTFILFMCFILFVDLDRCHVRIRLNDTSFI